MPYDYEAYFEDPKKLRYWKEKRDVDTKYLVPLIRADAVTLNAGAGLFVEQSILNLKKITCVDISHKAVNELKKKKIRAVQADLRGKWPFKDNEFEQVLLLDIFEHLGQVGTFLTELNRVSKPGARIILGIPLLNHWRNMLKLLTGSTRGVQYEEHLRMFFDRDVRELFIAAGFNLESAQYLGGTRGYGYYAFTKSRAPDAKAMEWYGIHLPASFGPTPQRL